MRRCFTVCTLLLVALVTAANSTTAAADNRQPVPPGGHAFVEIGKERAELPREVQVVAENSVQNHGGAFAGVGYVENVNHAMTWGILGLHSSVTIHAPRPELAINYAGMPDLPPADYKPVLLRLSPYKTLGRIVSHVNIRTEGHQSLVGSTTPRTTIEFDDQSIPTTTTDSGTGGEAYLTVDAPLEPGDYALVLRPKSAASISNTPQSAYEMMTAGSAVAGTQPWQYAWSFSVKY